MTSPDYAQIVRDRLAELEKEKGDQYHQVLAADGGIGVCRTVERRRYDGLLHYVYRLSSGCSAGHRFADGWHPHAAVLIMVEDTSDTRAAKQFARKVSRLGSWIGTSGAADQKHLREAAAHFDQNPGDRVDPEVGHFDPD